MVGTNKSNMKRYKQMRFDANKWNIETLHGII